MRTIETEADLADGLVHLAKLDRRLTKVIRAAGPIGLRRRPAGFRGLARTIVGQQLSVASASAIWARFEATFPDMTPEAVRRARDARFQKAGISAPKMRTLRSIAEACGNGLDIDGLAALSVDEAHARLIAVRGIGPWTADIYLLFCLGHPDVFPVGDLALRNAVADAFALEPPVDPDTLREMADRWSPWRSVAASLFWAYYGARRARKVVPL